MTRPQIVVRPNRVKEFIPLGRTMLADLIKQGLLTVVPLSPGGRAKGITMASIIEYQRRFMGLDPIDD